MAYVSNISQRNPDVECGPDIDRLQALQSFNARLVCMSVDDDSYQEVVSGVWKVLGCDACALFLLDQEGRNLELKAAVGYDHLAPGHTIPLSDDANPHAHAFNEEYLVHIDESQPGGGRQLAGDLKSVLVLPIISHNGPVGVFDFGSVDGDTFDQQEIGMCSMLVDQMSYSLENIRLIGELSRSRDAVIRGMALLAEIRDPHIGGHLDRICGFASLLATRLQGRQGFSEVTPGFVHTLTRAAALHDVGKVGIPDSILLKPGKLSDSEYGIMKTHTLIGAELLEGLMEDFGSYEMIAMGAQVARAHHEWWNGEGYPAGLKERAIPLAGRILSICDVYDALTSERVYKDAWSHEKTEQTIREGAGLQFDPALVDVFFENPAELAAIREKYPD